MPQNKRQIKLTTILLLTTILISHFFLISLAKTEVYFSLSDNPQKIIIKNINHQAQAFINIAMYVFTGSYNWTFSANNRNDENMMVIDDPEIIEIFQNQFVNLWTNKYSLERTRQLYQIAKVNFPFLSTTSPKPEVQTINFNTASLEELTSILQISKPLAWKIIALREELGELKEQKDLLQFTEITDLEWKEWKEQGIIINTE